MEKKNPGRIGRPREFDRDAALESAMMLFWRHGYEGVSVAQLTDAIGIAPASLYAAFGSKAQLYEEAVALYQRCRTGRLSACLQEDRPIRDTLGDLLRWAAETMTEPDGEPGCMVAGGMLFCAPENEGVAEVTAEIRRQAQAKLAERLRRAIDAGEIAGSADADDLSRYFMSLMHGMSIQARDGASREALLAVARIGLASVLMPAAVGR
jgi:TetR/AcrR family transcriptional regulator, copper-responsive repressor